MKRYLNGFTLAEILVTLMIIGVIATMTIPNIIVHTRKQEISARLKKFYSTFTQAIYLSENVNGPMKFWDFKTVADFQAGADDTENRNAETGIYFFDKYLGQYFRYYKVEKISEGAQAQIYFDDGSSMSIFRGGCFDFIYDVNGPIKSPNIEGRDRFRFLICPRGNGHCRTGEQFCSYLPLVYNTREKALAQCAINAAYCSTLLEFDNWEFKEDYPHKI